MTGMKKEELMQNLYGPTEKSEKKEIVRLNLSEINDFHRHTFRVVEDDEFEGLVESYRRNDKAVGPITVRIHEKYGNPYECIAGHRRRRAASKAGARQIDAVIVDMTDEEAEIWMADSNLHNRKIISLSEECRTVKVKYDAIKRQGKQGGRSDEQIADEQNMSRGKVQDMLKLSQLTDGMLHLVDRNLITRQVGKILAEMTKSNQAKVQEWLFNSDSITNKPSKITPEQAEEIVAISKSDNFGERNVREVYSASMPQEKKPPVFRLTEKDVSECFPAGYKGSPADKVALIKKLLAEHFDIERKERRGSRKI
jgi:ParB family chromosome partitioning protein